VWCVAFRPVSIVIALRGGFELVVCRGAGLQS
jgi:hypothetical protein